MDLGIKNGYLATYLHNTNVGLGIFTQKKELRIDETIIDYTNDDTIVRNSFEALALLLERSKDIEHGLLDTHKRLQDQQLSKSLSVIYCLGIVPSPQYISSFNERFHELHSNGQIANKEYAEFLWCCAVINSYAGNQPGIDTFTRSLAETCYTAIKDNLRFDEDHINLYSALGDEFASKPRRDRILRSCLWFDFGQDLYCEQFRKSESPFEKNLNKPFRKVAEETSVVLSENDYVPDGSYFYGDDNLVILEADGVIYHQIIPDTLSFNEKSFKEGMHSPQDIFQKKLAYKILEKNYVDKKCYILSISSLAGRIFKNADKEWDKLKDEQTASYILEELIASEPGIYRVNLEFNHAVHELSGAPDKEHIYKPRVFDTDLMTPVVKPLSFKPV